MFLLQNEPWIDTDWQVAWFSALHNSWQPLKPSSPLGVPTSSPVLWEIFLEPPAHRGCFFLCSPMPLSVLSTCLICILVTIHCCCCSVAQLILTLCDPMNCSRPDFAVFHCLPEFAQTLVHWVGDGIQPAHPVVRFSSHLQSFPTSGSFSLSRSLHQVAKVLKLQHQSFQWIFRVDFL